MCRKNEDLTKDAAEHKKTLERFSDCEELKNKLQQRVKIIESSNSVCEWRTLILVYFSLSRGLMVFMLLIVLKDLVNNTGHERMYFYFDRNHFFTEKFLIKFGM